MGKARKGKWERRVSQRLAYVRSIDPAKLAHAAMLYHRKLRAKAALEAVNAMRESYGDGESR